jgi:hypothetical protein
MGPMSTRRIHVRAPGVKTGSKIGPLGPFRGTLGIQWVIGAMAVGLVIVLAVTWILFREPGEPFREVEVFTLDQVAPGTAREALPGVYVGVTDDGQPIAVRHPLGNCELEFVEGRYLDCHEWWYDLHGRGRLGRKLDVLPLQIHRGAIYIDTSDAP